jgi:hypothetical protein
MKNVRTSLPCRVRFAWDHYLKHHVQNKELRSSLDGSLKNERTFLITHNLGNTIVSQVLKIVSYQLSFNLLQDSFYQNQTNAKNVIFSGFIPSMLMLELEQDVCIQKHYIQKLFHNLILSC